MDLDTEEGRAKSKQIEEEQLKGLRELNRASGRTKNPYTDADPTRFKGYRRGTEALRLSVERLVNVAIVMAIIGVGVDLTLGRSFMGAIIKIVSIGCFVVSIVTAVAGIVAVIILRKRFSFQIKHILIAGGVALMASIGYLVGVLF